MPSDNRDHAAAERKRLRDRVSQQNLRNKRNKHIQDLEKQVQLCRELHGPAEGSNADLHKAIQALREENYALRQIHRRLRGLLTSVKDLVDQPGFPTDISNAGEARHVVIAMKKTASDSPSSTPAALASVPEEPCITVVDPSLLPPASTVLELSQLSPQRAAPVAAASRSPGTARCSTWLHDDDCLDSASILEPSLALEELAESMCGHRSGAAHVSDMATPTLADPFADVRLWDLMNFGGDGGTSDLPAWACVPVRITSRFDPLPWDANMRLIFESPEHPAPLDLMYGSEHNSLANALFANVKDYYHGDAERLAISYLVYHFIKWRTQPSVERYSRLPDCLQLLDEQTSEPHPGCLDLIIWKHLRLNMVKNHNKYDLYKFVRLYCESLCLRWPCNEEVLMVDEEGRHVLRPDFVNHFMSESGWGLRADFVQQYPELFDGLEWTAIVYQPGS